MYELEGVLGPRVIDFVDRYVRSLLAWDILVFFHRNPAEVLPVDALASRLGRKPNEVAPEVDGLCQNGVLERDGDLIGYEPTEDVRESVGEFVEACQDRNQRLALIALVLQRIARTRSEY